MEILKPSLQADQVIRARRAELEQALDALGPAGIKERVSKGVAPSAAAEQSRKRV